jgi:hypothetical protein
MKRIPYRSLGELLRRELTEEEDPGTTALIQRVRRARQRKEFTRSEFLAMCRWKTPRSVHQCLGNPPSSVRRAARSVFATGSERKRVEALCRLEGVGIPTASAILTLVDPRRYGVIDIRVWQLLLTLGAVRGNPSGAGFRLSHWIEYLRQLRLHARRLGVGVRAVEYSLFLYHQRMQSGTLYRRPHGTIK